jgi:porin
MVLFVLDSDIRSQNPSPSPTPATSTLTAEKIKKDSEDPAKADEAKAAPVPEPADLWHRRNLTGDWGGYRSKLAEMGVNVDFSFTQFFQTISGSKPDTFDYFPNRFDLLVNVDTEKAGLWKGGGIGTHIETKFGGPPTGIALYPANAALVTPTTGEGRVVVSGLYLTQKLGKTSSIMFGKINMLDLLAAAPFMGGRGIDGFMHIAFAGPPSGSRDRLEKSR